MKKKIVVVANCQVLPIAKCLLMSPDVEDVMYVPIHQYKTKYFESFDLKFKSVKDEDGLCVLTYKTSHSYEGYSLESLQKKFNNVYVLTNIFFSGLHPDITYVGDRLGRIQSPLGDYHSKIVLHSFLDGLSVESCLARFNGLEYEQLSYYEEFHKSSGELLLRDHCSDIKFASIFLEMLRNYPALYTVNHPTGIVFNELNRLISREINIRFYQFPKEMISNYLSNSAWWPIYPEIKEYHNLKYETPFVFKIPDNLGGKVITLEEFVLKSYKIYSEEEVRLRNTKQASSLLARI